MTTEIIKTIKNKFSNFKILSQKFSLFNHMETKSLKVGYIIELLIEKEKSFVIVHKVADKYEVLKQSDIQIFPLASYLSHAHKYMNENMKNHPFHNEIKYNLIHSAKYLHEFSKTQIGSSELLEQFVKDTIPSEVFKQLEELEQSVYEKKGFPKELSHAKKKIKFSQQQDTLTDFISRYAFGHRQLMLFGEKGTGKTYAIRDFIDKYNYEMIKIDGHAGVDEYTLLGHLIRLKDGTFGWKNGALADAFRKAASGQKVVVFIDEILRLSAQTLNLLITAMDPYKGYYELEIDNPIDSEAGYVTTETIVASTENLWFICATNIGAQYEVSNVDEAFKDRFIMKEIVLKEQNIRLLLEQKIESKEFDYPVENLMNFYNKMKNFYDSKMVSHKINLRHIIDILEHANYADDIKILFHDKIYVWVGISYDGMPNQDELEIIKKSIEGIII